jgi:germination protein M
MKKKFLLILICAVLIALPGCNIGGLFGGAPKIETSDDSPIVEPKTASDAVEIALYFADWQTQHVVPEYRVIEDSSNLVFSVTEELLKGPNQPYLYRTFPEGVELNNVELKDDTVYVNFKGPISIPGSASEVAAINSLVLTLTDLPDINKVQILIDGKANISLGGHIDLYEPIERPGIFTYPIFIDEERLAWLQEQVNEGNEEWRRDPLQVAIKEGGMFGFSKETEYKLLEMNIDFEPNIDHQPNAIIEAKHNDQVYTIELIQPIDIGSNGIWTIVNIN